MPKFIKKKSTCRICGSKKLENFLNLGSTPAANKFLKKKDFKQEIWFPLVVYFCQDCYLVQLLDVVDKKYLFSQYVYFYSVMPTASQHFTGYAIRAIDRFITNPKKQLILEIGSNDGLLLKAFRNFGCNKVLGVDPAKNITKLANKNGIPTITDFFSYSLANKIVKKYGKAKLVIANNTVAHIDDLQGLVKGIKKTLDNKGVFIFEVPYIMDIFDQVAFDSIYHEHLSFFSLLPLITLFKQHKMEIFDVKLVKRQGNSIRVFVSAPGNYRISRQVKKLLRNEKKKGLYKFKTYQKLAKNVEENKIKLNKLLHELKEKQFRIAAYGAPARGNTILNYCDIGPNLLEFATEELESKINLYTPGMHIPVIDVKKARKTPPDYYLLLSWTYKDEILKKERDFIKKKGKFIIPVGVKII